LHFHDGTSVKGYGLIFLTYKIKFRASLDNKPDVWIDDIVKGITFHGFDRDVYYEYQYRDEKKRFPLLLEVLTYGEVKLYADIFSTKLFIPSLSEDVTSISTIQMPTMTKLYIKRDDEAILTSINGNFNKKVKAYFGDCIGLRKKLDSHEFRRFNVIEMVEYYNDFCTEL
jgi:hypothetical protein